MPASRHGSLADHLSVPHSSFRTGRFGRLFRNLAPFRPPAGKTEEQFSRELADQMRASPAESEDVAGDNEQIPAGYTYFGQFVDHDITFDPTSRLGRINDPERLHNFRTPRFDLDSVYGRGPSDSPFMYDQDTPGGAKFRMLIGAGDGANEPDLPRNGQATALIGDPRNDENTIVSQMQLVFLLYHNAIVDQLGSVDESRRFAEAQRIARWSYQYVVIHDFLRRLVGDDLVDELLPDAQHPRANHRRFYNPRNSAYIPVEFSVAAYRLGHSMVRNSYSLAERLDQARTGAGFDPRIPIFAPGNVGPLEDLRGRKVLPGLWTLQWDRFLDFGPGGDPQFSRRLDTKLVDALASIPAGPNAPNALAFLNLQRGFSLGLPSGQDVARAMGMEPEVNPDGHDPLWWYILKEAEQNPAGRLSGVGARIVTEVFVGLFQEDSTAYLNMVPGWTPSREPLLSLPTSGERFELRDLVRFSGAPIEASDFNASSVVVPRSGEGAHTG